MTRPTRHNRLILLSVIGVIALVLTQAAPALRQVWQAVQASTAPTGAPQLARGAEPMLADTDYPIPPDAHFVAPSGNNDQAGTQAEPWQTIAHAVDAAPSGATIVLRAGIYREAVRIAGKQLTIQPFPHEQVWMKGSLVVDDWQAAGAAWKKTDWRYQFRQVTGSGDAQHPLAGYPDMLFVDGRPLAQVARKADLTSGTFFVDYAAHALYVGDEPRGKTVEAAAFAQALRFSNASGSVVRGLGFAHYASPQQNGSVRGDANAGGLLFERNTFAWNAADGLSLLGPDAIVRGNLFAYNGQLGFHGFRTHRLLLEQNTIASNNQEYFNTNWEAGGVKIVGAEATIWRDNIVEYNIGQGLWCDISCDHTTIVRNLVRSNTKNGIRYEISAHALIASNVVLDNAEAGVYVFESEFIDVYNNTLSNNKQDLRVFEYRRTQSDDAPISRDVYDITIKNNIMADANDPTGMLLGVDDSQNQKSARQMMVSADYNLYHRSSSTPDVLVLWARGATDGRYRSLDAFRAAAKQEQHGIESNGADAPLFRDAASGDYRLAAGSPAIGAGEPLTATIASAIGVAAEAPVHMGALAGPAFPTNGAP